MNGTGGWFHRLLTNISTGFRRFMRGRYGSDKLNLTLVWASFILFIANIFVTYYPVNVVLVLLCYGLLGWAIFRMLSRNTYRRYRENRKYLHFWERLRDRKHKHFDCPRCRQTVRVPRGKGKISITCPKCKEKFIRKT